MENFDDLDDFELEQKNPTYEIWLCGNDEADNPTDFDEFVDDFDSEVEAKKCFDYFTEIQAISDYLQLRKLKLPADTKSITVRLEFCVENDDGAYTTALGTLAEEKIIL